MWRAFAWAGLAGIFAGALFAQSTDAPNFEIADVHVSPKTINRGFRTGATRGGRYELKNARMIDLIGIAYDFAQDKILGGPSWLEMDRFDVIAKVPSGSTPETQQLMLQSLLKDRFSLVAHKDSRPLPTYLLTAGKTLHLKKALGTEPPGCRPQTTSGAPGEPGARVFTTGPHGTATIDLGPGMTVQYLCRNITMAAFAKGMGRMIGASLGPNEVLDQTGLDGNWDFDVRWSMSFIGGPMAAGAADRTTIFDALEKQLGLKLVQKPMPTPVIVVDRVNREPTPNPPGVDAAFPVTPPPTEFEVADVKPTDPDLKGRNTRTEPGGRLTIQGIPLRRLIMRAFNTVNQEEVAGIPNWAAAERFDIKAKAPATEASASLTDIQSMAPLLRALLVERFSMAYHTENRPVTAYTLVSVKPKMKKADPASRTSCEEGDGPASAAPGSETLTCRNITMAQFVDELLNMGPAISWPVLDATGIEGGWDFALTFDPNAGMMMGRERGGDGGQTANGIPLASDPTGAISIFDAVEKQLGLKLEAHKRTLPVIVIDHIEQQPTDN